MWGWDDRSSGAGPLRPNQHDEATPNTAKIIPLRPWFDQPAPHIEDPPVMFADGKAPPGEKVSSAEAKIAEPQPVKPSMREEAKTPAPGSTVVIEQTTPAPPLRSGGDRDSGGSSGGGGGGGGGGR